MLTANRSCRCAKDLVLVSEFMYQDVPEWDGFESSQNYSSRVSLIRSSHLLSGTCAMLGLILCDEYALTCGIGALLVL